MGIVKSLIGALIGAAVAVGIHYGIKQSTGESYVWFPLVIGLLAGIGARVLASSSLSQGSRVVAGGVAALVAGLAMFGPDIFNSMQDPVEFGPIEGKGLVNASIAKNDKEDEKPTAEGSEKKPDQETQTKSTEDKSEEGSDAKSESSDSATAGDSNTDDSSDSSDANKDESTEGDADKDETKDPENRPEGGPDDAREQAAMEAANLDRSRGAGRPDNSPGAAANMEQFSELIKKKKHETWMQTFLPIIFSGVGMVLAYVIGQSGSAPPPKA